MGRKIPGRKHRKIKDPDAQRRKRFESIKNKINNPPKKDDDQEIPKSVLRIMELKEKVKTQAKIKRVKKKQKKTFERFDMERAVGKEIISPGMERPDKQMPMLQQGSREKVQHFARRINSACDDMLREMKFEEKFSVEVKRDESGNVTEIKPKTTAKKSKKPKLREKRLERLSKKLPYEEEKEFPKTETFEFGDIVHQPPTNLIIPGKKKKDAASVKPGKRDLLLKNAFNSHLETTEVPKIKKQVSHIEKQKQEERRKRVVEAFRLSKKQISL